MALHVLLLLLAVGPLSMFTPPPARPLGERQVIRLTLPPLEPEERIRPEPVIQRELVAPAVDRPAEAPPADPPRPRQLAAMAAPPAPTAEEWAFASRYTLKNSKGYRHTWGQQIRSMMGSAVEGPDQGAVRFRVEIAPDGRLTRLETLWATSALAEQRARQAIHDMPQWPPTPTGRPLIFEKTLLFTPFASEGPPIYQDDCLPDPPAFSNPFAWDGRSERVPQQARPTEPPDPGALEDCRRQLPQDSIEAESARDQRLMDQWGSGPRGR